MTARLKIAGQPGAADGLALVGGEASPLGRPGCGFERRQDPIMARLAKAGRQELPHAGAAPLGHHVIAALGGDVGLAAAREVSIGSRRRGGERQSQEKNGTHGRHHSRGAR